MLGGYVILDSNLAVGKLELLLQEGLDPLLLLHAVLDLPQFTLRLRAEEVNRWHLGGHFGVWGTRPRVRLHLVPEVVPGCEIREAMGSRGCTERLA